MSAGRLTASVVSALLMTLAPPSPAAEVYAVATPAGIQWQIKPTVDTALRNATPTPTAIRRFVHPSPQQARAIALALLEIERPSRAAGEKERTGVAVIRKLAKKAEHPKDKSLLPSLSRLIDRIAKEHGLEPALLHAVIRVESAYQPSATSPKGAMGLMQLMPATARRFGVNDPYDAEDNIRGGARYLRWLLDKFGDVELALAGYNAGAGAVVDWGGIPPYRETRRYVPRVLQAYRRERR